MDSPQPVTDAAAWTLAVAYIEAWNERDRDAWLNVLHPELEFHPSALVDTGVVFQGISGAAQYLDELIASERPEQGKIVGLRRISPDRFLIELKLLIDDKSVSAACVLAQIREETFVFTAGYLSDAETLTFIGVIPEDAPAVAPV